MTQNTYQEYVYQAEPAYKPNHGYIFMSGPSLTPPGEEIEWQEGDIFVTTHGVIGNPYLNVYLQTGPTESLFITGEYAKDIKEGAAHFAKTSIHQAREDWELYVSDLEDALKNAREHLALFKNH